MKKLLAGVLTVFTVSFGFAQQEVEFGVKGGINISNLSVNIDTPSKNISNVTSNSRTSFYVGGYAESSISDRVSLQAELQLLVNGGRYKLDNKNINERSDFSIRSLKFNIPILAKIEVFEGFKLNAGGYFDINLLTQVKDNLEEYGWINTHSDEGGKINTLGAGLLIGAEYNFPNGFFIEGRYNHGLTNALKIQMEEGSVITTTSGSQYRTMEYLNIMFKERFFQLGVGYKFRR